MVAAHPMVKQAVSDAVEQGKAAAIQKIAGISGAYRRGGRVRKYRRGGRVKRSCSCRH